MAPGEMDDWASLKLVLLLFYEEGMIKEATCFTKNAGLSPIFAKYSVIFGVKFLYRCQFCQLLNEIFLCKYEIENILSDFISNAIGHKSI